MKRLFICLLLLVPVMTFAGCSKGNDEPQAETPDTPDNPGDNEDNDDDDGSGTVKPGNGKILIAWFSRWGNTNYASDVDASTGASIIIDKGTHRGIRRSSMMSVIRITRSRRQEHFRHLKTALKTWINTMWFSSVIPCGQPMFRRRYFHSFRPMIFRARPLCHSVPMTDMEPAAAIVPCRLPHPVRGYGCTFRRIAGAELARTNRYRA